MAINANEAAKFINTWVSRSGYGDVFKGSASTILTEMRRESRPKANARKYGKVPYYRHDNGTVSYELSDLQTFCNDRLKPICANKLAIKLARLAGLNYYTPYCVDTDSSSFVVTDAMLDRLLADIDAPDPIDELLNDLDRELT